MNGKFDIESIEKPTNQDITIVFLPSNNVTSYTYQIYKDNIPLNSVTVDSGKGTSIEMKETGIYKISVNLNLKNGHFENITSGEYIIDKEAPKEAPGFLLFLVLKADAL